MTGPTRPLTLDAPLRPGGARRRVQELTEARPEWNLWLRLYAETLAGDEDPLWQTAAATISLRPDRPHGAPLLASAVVALPPATVDAWLQRLLAVAGLPADGIDAAALLEAAVNEDGPRLSALAAAAAVDQEAHGVVARLAALPLLRACGRRFGAAATAGWQAGSCPLCGAWPALAEQRGLEQSRRLRCGRCGADWGTVAFRCVFCGEGHHTKLGSLVPEGGGEARRVETCERCHGYLKTLATLRPAAADEVPLADLSTVELDLAALDRGYERPATPAVQLGLRIVEDAAGSTVSGEESR